MEQDFFIIKCVLLGDPCGKTYAVSRWIEDKVRSDNFDDDSPKLGHIDYKDILVTEDNKERYPYMKVGQKVRLECWEISFGDIDKLRHLSYPGTDIVLVAFDLTREAVVDQILTKWKREINHFFNHIPIVTAGMQLDSWDGDKVRRSTIENYARSRLKASATILCSSYTGEGINELFTYIINKALSKPGRIFSTKNFTTLNESTYLNLLKNFGYYSNETQMAVCKNIKFLLGKTILHVIFEKNFVKLFKFFFETYPALALAMVVEADTNETPPFFLTQESGSRKLVHKTIDFVIQHRITFLYGKRHEGILEKNVNCYFSPILYQAQKFLDSNEPNDSKEYTRMNIELLHAALKQDQNEKEDNSISFTNIQGEENILHILTKRNLSKQISNILGSMEKSYIYNLLIEKDVKSNTPMMRGAVNGNCNALVAMLAFIVVDNDRNKIAQILHQEDSTGHTLSYIVMNAGVTMIGPQGMIMQLEQDHHMENEDDKEGFRNLHECLHTYHGSSDKTGQSLMMINEARSISFVKKLFKIALLILGCFVWPCSLWFGDVYTDSCLVKSYYAEWQNISVAPGVLIFAKSEWQNNSLVPGYLDFDQDEWQNYSVVPGYLNSTKDEWQRASLVPGYLNSSQEEMTLQNYPESLSAVAKFFYSLMFMVLPFFLYSIEVLKSERHQNMFYILSSIVVYPCIQMIRNCYYQVNFFLAKGQTRKELEESTRETDLKRAFAHLLEVCVESSFQPLLQWYILLPAFCTSIHSFDYAEILSFHSWFLSFVSLSWSFTAYQASLKHGALSLSASPISRILIFTSNICLIFARMNCIIVFMYFWGPGQFYPGIVFILLHAIMMGALHHILSSEDQVYSCIINGLANIFNHNLIEIPKNNLGRNKTKQTFFRQFLFDLIFLIENIVLMVFGCSAGVHPLNDLKTMAWFVPGNFCLHFLGLSLKIVYYKCFHLWKEINGEFFRGYKLY